MRPMVLLRVQNLVKRYRSPEGPVQTVLDVPAFELAECEQVALAGTSGSGKTTFLHVIAGILRADEGLVEVDGVDLLRLSEAGRDKLRARSIGYVFQTFHLLGAYSALENVVLGMSFGGKPDQEFAKHLLEELGLESRMHHRPHQLSVGQQQRVALARALAGRPKLVLADEPTGNLDEVHSAEALGIIRRLCREYEAALLLVSHDRAVLDDFERSLDFSDLNRAGGALQGQEGGA
ncbi:MAG: ABC-type lipoprotein export system ATPase subunit [Planctomycetota bacterium]